MKYPAQSDLWRFEQLQKAQTLGQGKSRVIGRFKQVFPMAFFPDELIIEELRIVWVQNNGFWSNQVISIMGTDIACVYASSGPFFGHVHIQSLTGGQEIKIDNLTRFDTYKVRGLVEGIALASREGLAIDKTDLDTERQGLFRAGRVN